MGSLFGRLSSCQKLGLDTSVFIYHFEANPVYLSLTTEILKGIEVGHWKGITSVITLMEINVRPLRLGQPEIARMYEAILVHFPNLKIINLDRDVVRKAAFIRANYHLHTADALQAAACILHGCDTFITNDRLLNRLQAELNVVLLDDLRQDQSQ
ncbi:MAG: type II toxin-antitoxin system VapC family toxin [Anaerolineales bacterium]|nr:type II toxin-antitoxin system VapC family toxin [Anaerolineales bacterium]